MDKWQRLLDELEHLQTTGVTSIHPTVILSYMSFLDELEHCRKMLERDAIERVD